MAPEVLRELDLALLRCGAAASALRHPNREHPPNSLDRERLKLAWLEDLRHLRSLIDSVLGAPK